MSAADSRKGKRKKSRKAAKISNGQNGSVPSQQTVTKEPTLEAKDIEELERLMDEEDGVEHHPSKLAKGGPLPYLGRERCLLCRCENPDAPKSEPGDEGDEGDGKEGGGFPQLYVCADCKKTVEEEDKKVLEPDLGMEPPFFPEMGPAEAEPPGAAICNCEACTERRQIEAEHEKETQELQQCWMELRHVVRCVYREAGTGLSESDDTETTALPDIKKMKELVHRLVTRDPHQLYQRLESQGREYVIEMKVRLLKQLTSGHKTPPQAKQFVSMLLEEYSNLCAAAKTLASFLTELEKEHLKRFNLTWELHNKHLFQSIIYTDPLVQNSLPMLITQLRLGAASKEPYHEDAYPNILHRYLKFDDEMSVISVVWRDCQQHLEEYHEQQAAMKAKQKMLKEDWEFFRAQRKLLEQTILQDTGEEETSNGGSSAHNFEVQFKETMRHILQGTKPNMEECHCPNCNRKRCPCDECTISHMITCGIISPEVVEQMPVHTAPPFTQDPSRYIIDVTPPSMSSTTSSSGSSSPIMVDPERLALPFEDCPETFEEILGDDGMELEGASKDSDDETSEDEEDDDGRGAGDGEAEGDATQSLKEQEEKLVNVKPADRKLQERGQTEGCDCTHCSQKAKVEQTKLEENQCQCHACLQQSGKPMTTIPQPQLTTPRPAALHLYPHIHGSSGNVHPNLQNHNNAGGVRPLLHPHLYELHTPLRPQKAGHPNQQQQQQKKHQLSLDLESQEALQEHIYHAYGEWDNAYDSTRFILNTHKYGGSLGSELFNSPPPPLLNGNPFLNDALSGGYMDNTLNSVSVTGSMPQTSASLTSPTTIPASQLPPRDHGHEACLKNLKPINRSLFSHSMTSKENKISTMSSTTITTTTNNVTVTAASTSGTKSDVSTSMADHCLKHNPFISNSNVPFSANNLNTNMSTATSTNSYPLRFTTEMLRSAAALKEEAVRALGTLNQPLGNFNFPSHSCTHTHSHTAASNQLGQLVSSQGAPSPHMVNPGAVNQSGAAPCSNLAPPASPMGNVSVGTSTVCNEAECDGHHDDNYDSIDDSCSEQSSSTSTSNQKEGKYCDCCYCEVFGHSNPPVAPTSKNYTEMRDKLRLRLKKKNEQKTTDDDKVVIPPPEEEPKPEEPKCQKDPLGGLSIDEIVQYINGGEDEKNAERALSTKAAKRARQKQRKAEEKAKKGQETKNANVKETPSVISARVPSPIKGGDELSQTHQDSLPGKKKTKQKKMVCEEHQSSQEKRSDITVNVHHHLRGSVDSESRHIHHHMKNNGPPTTRCLRATSSAGTASHQGHEIVADAGSPRDSLRVQKKNQKRGRQSPPSDIVNAPVKAGHQHTGEKSIHSLTKANASANSNPRHDSAVCSAAATAQQQAQFANASRNRSSRQAEASSKKKGQNGSTPRLDAGSAGTVGDGSEAQASVLSAGCAKQPKHARNVTITTEACPSPVMNGVHGTASAECIHKSPQKDPSPVRSKSETRVLTEANRNKDDKPVRVEQTTSKKKNKKKNKSQDDLSSVDEIFMPKYTLDLENGDLDESERELEEFKRFCFDSTPSKQREKLQVNMNLKDIFSKKKQSGISCA